MPTGFPPDFLVDTALSLARHPYHDHAGRRNALVRIDEVLSEAVESDSQREPATYDRWFWLRSFPGNDIVTGVTSREDSMISHEAEARENEIRGMPESMVEEWMEEEGRATQTRVRAALKEARTRKLARAGRWIVDRLTRIADTNVGYLALGLSFFLVVLWGAVFAIAVFTGAK